MKTAIILPLTLFAAVLVGCGTTTTSRTGTGAMGGAAAGAAIGSMSGNAGKGALIGAGVGALGGYVYDQQQREREQYRYGDRYPYRDREYREGRYPVRYRSEGGYPYSDRNQTSERRGW